MYSVIRFSGFSGIEDLHEIGDEVNRLLPAPFGGPDRVLNRFSCSLSKDDDWGTQCRSIEEIIPTLSPAIRKSAELGVRVEIDVAIEPEDHSGRFLADFPLGQSFLKILVEANVAFRFSLYGVGPH
ncbi:hypothetical protein TA3x_000043 [Tundrisphaera sp. TA3]|uniref:hypothetical protein n=1 Tax=Tundrisphaera sp. TA3 TaxID=3435775 RepID=UPI003EC1220C